MIPNCSLLALTTRTSRARISSLILSVSLLIVSHLFQLLVKQKRMDFSTRISTTKQPMTAILVHQPYQQLSAL